MRAHKSIADLLAKGVDPLAPPPALTDAQRSLGNVLRQSPFSVCALVGAGILGTGIIARYVSTQFIVTWWIAFIALAFLRSLPWLVWKSVGIHKTTHWQIAGWTIAVLASACGAMLMLLPFAAWRELSSVDQNQMTAFAVGLSVVGALALVTFPMAAGLWVLTTGTIFVAFVSIHIDRAIFWAPYVVFAFFAFLFFGVRSLGRSFTALYRATAEADRQREMVALLLQDFEEEAREWLWETDAQFRLTYASPRLSAIVGREWEMIQSKSIVDLLAPAAENDDAQHIEMPDGREALLRFFNRKAPFRNQIVEYRDGTKPRFLSITAKPLIDESGTTIGWRGTGIDVTAEFERRREMERLASVDPLTGLANRSRLNQEIERYFPPLRTAEPSALILLDLDDFKFVNDRFGHPTGDRLLQQIALRLTTQLRPGQLLARLGGDEFALVVPGDVPRPRLAEMGERLISAMSQPYLIDDVNIVVRCSIGIAVGGIDAHDSKTLLKNADLALYAAKDAGRNAVRFFGYDMHQKLEDRFTLTEEMRRGLDQNQFALVYQPFIDLVSGEVRGFEALLRWNHPTRGLMKPDQFVSVAEESSIISQLGAWVFEQACRDAVAWPTHLRVAVNVSAAQFSVLDLRATIESALQKSGLLPERLEVELTESTLFADAPAARRTMVALRNRGVQLSLDDFGSGHASLNHLRAFPITRLKVDRTFTAAIAETTREGNEARAIVRAAIELARAMELDSTAEGVETQEQLDVLKRFFCDEVQGYFISYPIAQSEIHAYLSGTDPNKLPREIENA